MEATVPTPLVRALEKQKYHLIGKHSAVKRCRWFYETLIHNRPCYKQKFYGIRTHQCIQMTPSVHYCNQRCLFCWRAQSGDLEVKWEETRLPIWNAPEEIVEESIKAQLRILSGYRGNPKTDGRKFTEASKPKHVAISLTGEPTLYAQLGELIRTFHRRGLTTFLVTNGTRPSVISNLKEEPTQLYVSVCAPNKETYQRVCRPQIPRAWENLNETLKFLPSFESPTVIRMTLARSVNMEDVKGYAQLVKEASPTYIEAKAYMHVGFSRLRLGFVNMPDHSEIRDFAAELANETGYRVVDESEESRVVLLSKLDKPIRFDNG